MKKKSPSKRTIKKIVIVFIALSLLAILSLFLYYLNVNQQEQRHYVSDAKSKYINYSSMDMGLALKYPENWFIDDRYGMILLANYKTDLNKVSIKKPGNIIINIYSEEICDMSLDEQIQLGRCYAEGNWSPTDIIDKQISELSSGVFYKYTIKHPQGEKQIIYYLQKGDRMLKISKEPDTSVFDKEFVEIINSINFL